VRGSDTPSIEEIDPICTEPFDSTPISRPFSPTTPSYVDAFHESLGDIRVDQYCAYLADMPRQIMWSTFFDHTFDFSMVFVKFKRPLTFLRLL